MGYFAPNKRKVLSIIFELTSEKPYTGYAELESHIPQKWKLRGCGTQNLINVIVELYREGLLEATEGNRQSFLEGRDITGRDFFLSYEGRRAMRPWPLRHWQIIVGILVSVATVVTAIYTALEYHT